MRIAFEVNGNDNTKVCSNWHAGMHQVYIHKQAFGWVIDIYYRLGKVLSVAKILLQSVNSVNMKISFKLSPADQMLPFN
jgi:hypothetical protein